MRKKISIKIMHYLMPFALCLLSTNCVGPLEGEEIKFLTPNVYENLSPDAARIEIITEKSGWTFSQVQYNDTIAYLSSGRIYKSGNGEVQDPLFSYDARSINKLWTVDIKGSFFSIRSESLNKTNNPRVITVDIDENKTGQKRVLSVQLLNLDNGAHFRIEQNSE